MLTKEFINKLKYYHTKKEYKSLIKDSKEMLKKHPNSFFLCDILASTYGILENFYVAIEYYKKALNIEPDSYEICCSIGISYLKLNNLDEAKKYFLKAIEMDPSKSEGYIRLAVMYGQQSDFQNSVLNLEKAISLEPNNAQLYYLGGTIFSSMKNYDDAFMFYNQCLTLMSDHNDCLRTISQLCIETEDYEKAKFYLKRLLSFNPDDPDFLNNYGVASLRMGEWDEANSYFNKVLELKPDHVDSMINLAHIFTNKKDFDKSKELLNKALDIEPNSKLAKIHLASLSLYDGKVDKALKDLSALEEEKIEDVSVFINLGNAHLGSGQYVKAMQSYKKALDLEPRKPETLLNIGNAFRELKKYQQSISSYNLSLKYKPGYYEAYNNLGVVYSEMRDHEKAIENFNIVLKEQPDNHTSLSQKLYAQAQICDWSSFEKDKEYIKNIGSTDHVIPPFCLLFLDDDPEGQLFRAKEYVRKKYNITPLDPIIKPKNKPKKIKVAYFSSDFYDHATMHLMSKLFKLHDKNKFEIHVYAYDLLGIDQTKKELMENVDHYHDVKFLSDAEVALQARNENIDIAIDLKGFTLQTRIGIFAYRFAPIQISYLGYPGTTGANFIDYIIADEVVIPSECRKFYSEKIIYMPDSYQINNDERVISEKNFSRSEFGLPEKSFVYCCFNQPYKITPNEFPIWMNILRSVPNSVLWLLQYNEKSKSNLKQLAENENVDPHRLIFSERMPNSEHLARHKLADLFLDTFNVNAHTTTSDSLWGELPVLTMAGRSFASRVSASLLNSIGLEELITYNKKDYERLAIEIGNSPNYSKELKDKLIKNKHSTPLFDSAKFTNNLENIYIDLYDNYFEGKKMEDLNIKKALQV